MTKNIAAAIHEMEPVDTQYVLGRWHHDRVSLGGFGVEARVFLKSLVIPRTDNRRFLIVGRARSGTTLLTRLLNGHSRIHCDGEVLKRNVLAPLSHLEKLADKSNAAVYGAKFLSYQMVQVHRIKDPTLVARELRRRGFALIHLKRDTFFQTLSLAVAQRRSFYHSDQGRTQLEGMIWIEPEEFCKRIAWSEALLAYEREFFSEVEHLTVDYDLELVDRDEQRATLDRICNALGVPTETVATPLKKVLSTEPSEILENYDEIAEALVKSGFGHLVPGHP